MAPLVMLPKKFHAGLCGALWWKAGLNDDLRFAADRVYKAATWWHVVELKVTTGHLVSNYVTKAPPGGRFWN